MRRPPQQHASIVVMTSSEDRAPAAGGASDRVAGRSAGPAARRRGVLVVTLGVLAVPAGVAAASLVVASDLVDRPGLTAFVTLLAGWAFVAGGLVAWTRQPDNRIGALMVLAGFLVLAGSLTSTDSAVAFTVGLLAAPVADAVAAHLLLAFPDGRLHSRAERMLVVAAYADVTVLQVGMLLFMDYRTARGCPCPRNLLFSVQDDAVHSGLMTVQRLLATLTVAGVIVVLARRWRSATAPQRRSLGPVFWTGAVTVLLTGGSLLANQVSDGPAGRYLGLAATAALAFVPLGFLVGLLRSRLARAAVGDLVIELGQPMAPGQLRDALARALGDHSVELAYRLSDSDDYVDLAGRRVELPAGSAARTVTFVHRQGRRIAAVVHDASLNDDPTLVEAACAAAGLALENERLQAELRARLAELQASRTRIVQAGDTERRRLERNLHDGAQQRLVSLSVALGLAESRLPADPQLAQAMLTGARQELGLALAELRELARGIHPAVLTDHGLHVALEAVAARAPLPVDLDVPPGRLPEPVEAAAYYLVCEAVANSTRYAHAQGVSVTVARQDGRVVVTISDDGVGGADPSAGSGLRGLADRVEALDGRLSVSSPPGGGTTIEAVIPCG
jgi:signal transduction histidine kinase